MFIAATLNAIPGVTALHEGHIPGDPPIPKLPLLNVHNRRAWHEPDFGGQAVAEMRNAAILVQAANGSRPLVDVAFNNAPILSALAQSHPDAALFVIFRRCEAFVRSATLLRGEDPQPAGWPDTAKPLTDREKFISLGRLKPKPGSDDAQRWPGWTAIQRNVWLWHHVNSHLLRIAETCDNCVSLIFEDLAEDPRTFWTALLRQLDLESESNLDLCVARSARKLNQRPGYQIGPISAWSAAERDFYGRLAEPLEKSIYG
jgi:hypothetical protein